MSQSTADLDAVGDAELIAAVRGGDLSAYGALFERHVAAARRLARQLTNATDADDLVSDAFGKVLRVLQDGGGPDLAFRAYLLTAVRRLHIDRIRAGARVQTTDDLEPFDPGVPFRDTAVEGFENQAAATAFASLPERWQMVLWHTEVEGQKPAEVAALLGMSANSVSALAYRAREGLRQAFLNSHAPAGEEETCRWTHDHLGGYVRQGLSRRDATKVEKHLDECRRCMAIYLELTEVNSRLGALLAPLLLGTAGAAYLAGASGLAAKGGLALLLGRARDALAANTQAAAVAGVAAVTVAAGVTYAVATAGDPNPPSPSAAASPDLAQPSAEAPADVAPTEQDRARPPRTPARTQPITSPVTSPISPTTSAPPVVPPPPEPTASPSTADPSGEPTTRPTDKPTTKPTDAPTAWPTDEPTTPGPTEEPSPTEQPTEPTYDLVLAVHTSSDALRTSVTFTASGFAPGGTALLALDWHGLVIGTVPGGCQRTGLWSATCRLDEANPSVTGSLVNLAVGGLTATLTPVGFEDADGSNNSWSWP